jgi:hypothetical protein
MEKSIEDWCNYFRIRDYVIDKENLVSVNGYVNISEKDLDKIPIKFDIIFDYFYCDNNKLVSLEGSPRQVGAGFYCNINKLKSLNGCPEKVGDIFNCEHNLLFTLEGLSVKVGRHFYCGYNKLISLKSSSIKLNGDFFCSHNPIYEEYSKYDSFQHYMRKVKLNQLI